MIYRVIDESTEATIWYLLTVFSEHGVLDIVLTYKGPPKTETLLQGSLNTLTLAPFIHRAMDS